MTEKLVRKLTYTREAQNDLESIAKYTQRNWGTDKRREYLRQLNEKAKLVAAMPRVAVSRGDIERGCRTFVAGQHLLVFRVVGQRLEVLRVLHMSMDVEREILRKRTEPELER
ncbi:MULTISPECIES: type II toxin-antitoxin system RelE/ParE family toxin [Alphaproteobacteria]|uniref:type II toxin-antitoxin system RelE/ParE family toxin n=1 Tax=Alphaproteobacteria TaxID=28211 RepID=UPI0032999287